MLSRIFCPGEDYASEDASGGISLNGKLMSDRPAHAPPRSRWTSFVADSSAPKSRSLHEDGNPPHRLRVEHNRDTLLIELSGEDGQGWLVLAVDRDTRRWALAESRRKLDASREAFARLYADDQ